MILSPVMMLKEDIFNFLFNSISTFKIYLTIRLTNASNYKPQIIR